MGLFSRDKGDDVSRKQKRSGEDETSVNSGVEHAPPEGESELERTAPEPGDRSGEDETSVNAGVQHAPPEDLAHRAAVRQEEGESDEDYQARLKVLSGTTPEPQSGYLLGRPQTSAHDGNTKASEIQLPDTTLGGGTPPIQNLTQQEEFAADTRRARLRQYVIEQGLVPPGAIGDMTDEELDAVYERAIGRTGRNQTEPDPTLSVSPAQHAQAVLMSSSRGDKLALVAEKSNLSYAQAAQLTDPDLNDHVRSVVITELQREETKKAEEAAKLRPLDETPYGGDVPKFYVVRKGVRYAGEGGVVSINPGDLLNDRSHNIVDLKARGVQLIETVAPDPTNL